MNKVVVIGAGYAGIAAVKKLQKNKNIEITLIDTKSYHEMKTEIHLIASGKHTAKHAKIKLNDVINMKKINFINDLVTSIDYDKKEVLLENTKINYDYLILATGAQTNFFGNDANIKGEALTFWDIKEAENTWSIIKNKLEEYKGKEEELVITTIGAGATGIEFVTDLSENLQDNYKDVNIKLNLVAADKKPLIMLPDSL